MKIRILDRILVFLAGLLLLLAGGAVLAEQFLHVEVFAAVERFLAGREALVAGIACAVALLLGLYCVSIMFRHKKGKRGFVMQQTENGELSISIKAVENLVQKCIEKHEELHVLATGLENSRDGLVIKLRIGLASGVSIPLVVSALQKQIRQYVTACTGVDVREIKVQVETASAKLKDSPYAVPELPGVPAAEKLASAQQEPGKVGSPVTVLPPEPEKPVKRPLHQRLFGREEQSMDVPEPPKDAAEEQPRTEEPAPAAESPAEKPADASAAAEETVLTSAEETAPKPEEAAAEADVIPAEETPVKEETHEIAQ